MKKDSGKLHNKARKFGFTTAFTKFRDLQCQFRTRNREPMDASRVFYKANCNDCKKIYTRKTCDKLKKLRSISMMVKKTRKKKILTTYERSLSTYEKEAGT